MAVQILSQSYGPRKPLIECTADSLSDLAGLVCAEGSTATVGGTEYVLDRVNGWVEPGSGGGGGSGVLVVNVRYNEGDTVQTLDKTVAEILAAVQSGSIVVAVDKTQPSAGVYNEYFTGCDFEEAGFTLFFVYAYSTSPSVHIYEAATENDYPASEI